MLVGVYLANSLQKVTTGSKLGQSEAAVTKACFCPADKVRVV